MMQGQATAPAQMRLVAPIRAAICARVSSDQQAGRHTIDSQVEALLAHAAADGHEIAPGLRFPDHRHSGASLVRPALERLRGLAAMGAIGLGYVHAPDRLARSYAHQAVLVEEFGRAGAEVVFLNRPTGQAPEDTLLLRLQGMFAGCERTCIAERSRRSKRRRAQAGSVSVLSRAPHGCRCVGREAGGGAARFEVAETEAEVVRRIFRRVGEERVSLSSVCRRLFEAAVPSPAGKAQRGRSTVWALLTNFAFAGQALFGKTAPAPWRPPLRPFPSARPAGSRPCPSTTRPSRPRPWSMRRCSRRCGSSWTRTGAGTWRARAACRRACWFAKDAAARSAACGRGTARACQRTDAAAVAAPGRKGTGVDGQRRCDARPIRVGRLDEAVWREVRHLLEDPARAMEECQRCLQAVRTGPCRPELETVERQLAKLRGGGGRLRPACPGTAMPSSAARSACPVPARRDPARLGAAHDWEHDRARHRSRAAVRPSGRAATGCFGDGSLAAMVAAGSICGVGELGMALRRAGKGCLPGVNARNQFCSWEAKPEEAAQQLDPAAWARLSAGEGTKGPRLHG